MKKKIWLGIVALITIVALLVIVWIIFAEKPSQGTKDITIVVIGADEKSTIYEVKTNAEYLRGAMDDAEGLEYSGDKSGFGLKVTTVNGDFADFDVNGAYWGFFVNGKYCNYGIETQPVNDGDEFQIIYTAPRNEE